jgi:uncharacterized membrane protein YebE (DUF533 family)
MLLFVQENRGELRMISDSRFYMWRAVIALAHADGHVVPAEKEFVEGYLTSLPFTEAQKKILREDLSDPQGIREMFDMVSDLPDQSDFFEFARMLVWCDGDFAVQEKKLLGYISGAQMARLNPEALQKIIRDTRQSAELKRLAEDEEFKAEAKGIISFGNAIKRGFGKRKKAL